MVYGVGVENRRSPLEYAREWIVAEDHGLCIVERALDHLRPMISRYPSLPDQNVMKLNNIGYRRIENRPLSIFFGHLHFSESFEDFRILRHDRRSEVFRAELLV